MLVTLVAVTRLTKVTKGRNHQRQGAVITPHACRDCGMPRPNNTQIINMFARMDGAGRAMAQSLQENRHHDRADE